MLDYNLLYLVIKDECLDKLIDKGITEDHFIHKGPEILSYIRDKVSSGRYPSYKEISETFDIYYPEDLDSADFEYYTEEIQKRYVTKLLEPYFKNAKEFLEDKSPLDAIEELRKTFNLRKVLTDKTNKIHSFKQDFDERLEHYQNTKDFEGIYGIESRWPSINEIGGWANGLFYCIVGATSVGKSWVLAAIADNMSRQINKEESILVVSTEMFPTRFSRRLDSVKFKIPFDDMKKGDLSEIEENKWADNLQKIDDGKEEFGDILCAGKKQVKTVADILILVHTYNPKAVLIDGGYRLDVSSGGDWGKQVRIIEDIQDAVLETNIPWIVTSQQGSSQGFKASREGKSHDSSNMRYAKEWIINPDVVISLRQDEDLSLLQRLGVQILKDRDGSGELPEEFFINVDRNKMTYEEIQIEETSEEEGEISY